MTPEMFNVLLTNVSFGSLFVALFVWTLRSSERREEKYQIALVNISDKIVATLAKIVDVLAVIEKQTADHPHNRRKDD